MNKLVFISNSLISAELFTTGDIIADYAEISHHAINVLIDKHKSDLEEFGILSFEMTKKSAGRGRSKKIFHLNEQQATLLITYLSNTKTVRNFKKALVRQFFDMRHELDRRKVYRELERPVRRSLTDAIKDWEYSNQWSYKTITDLICKTITGRSTKQLKKERAIDKPAAGTDIYTSDELAAYQKLETKVITLIDLGMTYKDIKAVLSGQPLNIELKAKKSAKKDLLSRRKLSKPSK